MKTFSYIGDIPIFVNDLSEYASEAYYLYSRLISNHLNQANNLARFIAASQPRRDAIKRTENAVRSNLETLVQIVETLEPYVSPKHLVKFNPNNNDDLSGFLKDFRYLKRDWGWDVKSEMQLKQINDAIISALSSISFEKNNALFLGAGVGRISFDLAHLFEKIFLTDKSFSMAYHYHYLLKKDLAFHEINSRNLYSSNDVVKKISATMAPKHLSSIEVLSRLNKLNYFVSDVRQLPFDDNSVSSIFSIYFTDVIALKLWLPEIKRVLKPNGLFIHFGPLDYFFSDESLMYSAEEFIVAIEQNNFTTLHDENIETLHLPSEISFSNKIYNNWLFVARKDEMNHYTKSEISSNNLLELEGQVKFNVKGVLAKDVFVEELEIEMPDGETFDGAETVFEIIKIIREGRITVSSLHSKLENLYGTLSNEQTDSIMRAIRILVDYRVIKLPNE